MTFETATTRIHLWIAVAILALFTTVPLSGLAEPSAYMTLKGLDKAIVVVDGVRSDFSRFGLDADRLKDATATRLRASGIEIVDHATMQNDPTVALVRIKLNANENQYRFYHYGIKLELDQKIPFSDQGGYLAETTWTSGRTGVLRPMDLDRLNGYTADLVDLFLKDYRAQNPQRVSTVDE